MSLDNIDDYLDEYGLFLDAPFVLTKEEYSAKVLFDEGLLQSIQNSRFSIDLPYERNMIDDSAAIAFNFGDLLTYIPVFERLKWKDFYQRMETDVVQMDEAFKLLFFDFENTSDLDTVKDYWKKRSADIEITGGQPWLSASEMEQTLQESHFLKAKVDVLLSIQADLTN
jgi:hypothetical protein